MPQDVSLALGESSSTFGADVKGVLLPEHHTGFCTPICAVDAKPDDVPAKAENADEGLYFTITYSVP